jgi:hypothetical protein
MIELFSFVKVLCKDFEAVSRGVSIEYGSKTKYQVDVSQLMGHSKKRKHRFVNDGRAPDTTEALPGKPTQKKIKSEEKIGRPKNLPNVNRNIYSTYPSYQASSNAQLPNRCWMAAALESLFALYSPLWLRNSTGTGSDLFTTVVKHFAASTTYELT